MMRFLFLIMFCGWLLSALTLADEAAQLSGIRVYTQSDKILEQDHREDLLAIVMELSERSSRLEAGLELVDKTVRDFAHLRSLSFDLESLAASKYSADIASISATHFQPLVRGLNQMQQRLEGSRPNFEQGKRLLSDAELDKLLQSGVLFFQDQSPTQHSVTNELRGLLQSALPKWERHYARVLKKQSSGALSVEDTRFLKTYGRTRMYLVFLLGEINLAPG